MDNKSNPNRETLSRRDAVLVVLSSAAVTVAYPVCSKAAGAEPVTDYVPENDYPFFGGTLPEGYEG